MIDLVENQVVRRNSRYVIRIIRSLEVCSANSFIRAVLLKSEIKFEEKRKRAEQSDDSLEENHEQTLDSLSDDDDDDQDDLHVLFQPIPEKQQRWEKIRRQLKTYI